MKDPLNKRADLKVRELAWAWDQSLNKADISWETAWNTLADKAEVGGALDTTKKTQTEFDLYHKDTLVHTFQWKNEEVFDASTGDWDWTRILREVTDYIISEKVIKKPRAKRSDAGKSKKPKPAKKAKKTKIAKKPARKPEKKADILRELGMSTKDLQKLFIPLKRGTKCDLTPAEQKLWRRKKFSANESLYHRYKEHKDIDEHMKKYIGIVRAMREHGVSTYINADWIRQYFNLPYDD